jgi:hypothetical protein
MDIDESNEKINYDRALVNEMINIASTSKTGAIINKENWKYILYDCVRLEKMSVQKCKEYSLCNKLPLYTKLTPMPTTYKELDQILNYCPFMLRNNSVSMLDKFYDELLHLNVVCSENKYILYENYARMQFMKSWLLSFNTHLLFMRDFMVEMGTASQHPNPS